MADYQDHFDYLDCCRGQFPDNSRIVTDREFLDQLAAQDANAEVLWNPRRGKWSLYRVVHYGASPADDRLEHEFDLPGPPGTWLIDYMRGWQLIVPGGAQDMVHAKQDWMTRIRQMIVRRRQERKRMWADFMHDFRGNLNTYVRKSRRSDAYTRFEHKNPKASLRDGQTRVFVAAPKADKITGTVHEDAVPDKPEILIAS